ncbi:GNAT family N-acetyltransferase [Haploplasma axanthum]|nr:GNAT family N-acetyltransferase [Haploplasma axanthum]
MADLVVNLYEREYLKDSKIELKNKELKIKRLLSPNADKLVEFVEENFSIGWASEVKAGIYKSNPSCFVAIDNGEIVGFACYDATAKGYFGPTGVNPKYRGLNIGQVLLLTTLDAMRSDGYGYAIIGGVSDRVVGFYSKYCNVIKLDAKPDLYSRLINR